MALVYKRSAPKTAREYERSSGMEPNPGVSHMTVVQNPGRRGGARRVSGNPFQWITGRGQRHRHVSPSYQSLRSAAGWRKRNPKKTAQLYPVDEWGTLVSRPINEKLLGNRTRRTGEMAYNIGALRRAMRSNPRARSAIKEERTAGGVTISSRAKPAKRRRKSRRASRKVASNRRRGGSVSLNKRRSTRRRRSRRSVAPNRRRSRRSSRRRRSVTPNRRRSRRSSRRRSSRRNPKYVIANRRRSRRGSRRTSRRRRSVAPNRRRRSRRGSRRTSRRILGNKRASKGRRKTRRSSKGKIIGYVGKTAIRSTGHSTIDQYLLKGKAPPVVRVARTYGENRFGPASISVYSARPKGRGSISARKTSKGRTRKFRWYGKQGYLGKSRKTSRKLAANRRRSRRSSRRRRSVAPNRRRSRRSSRRRSSRRNPKYVIANRRRSRRSSRRRRSVAPNRRRSRRSSRRRRSRRGLTRNMLATGGVRWKGRGRGSRGKAAGKIVQVVELGPKSQKAKGKRGRITGYPVYIPGHVNERAYVRSYYFGGAALDARTKAQRSGYSEKKYKRRRVTPNRSRRTSMRKNRRRSSRRRSTRRNPKYVIANRRRRVRRNGLLGSLDVMNDVAVPVLGGVAGFAAARVLSNSLANIGAIRNILDSGRTAAEASNTKLAANVLIGIATLGLATQVKAVRDNQGALITGMGLALADRLLGKLSGPASEYLSGFGEYVNQPLGEYLNQPLGAYVNDPGMGTQYATAGMGQTLYAAAGMGQTLYAAAGIGEYVNQSLGMYAEGVDPANMAGIDGLMDVMEAAAGGPMEAAAGFGTMYATAGLGAEHPSFTSTTTPTDVARLVAGESSRNATVSESLVTPEGKGYAGGLFSRHLFGGML